MSFTLVKRFGEVEATNVSNATNLLGTATGVVNLPGVGDFVQIRKPLNNSDGTTSFPSDDIPQGTIITGIEYAFAFDIGASTFPTSIEFRAQILKGTSTQGDVVSKIATSNLAFNTYIIGGNGNFLGLENVLNPYSPLDFNDLQLKFSHHATSGVGSPSSMRVGGANYGSSIGGQSGPLPYIKIYYKGVKVVITNPTKVVLNNNKKIIIGNI
tara:strand:- start:2452 stop:3087 length:636 start_codon:yes stop_codon:yes gene_type:complete